jgi:hypothetical protein
MSALFGKPFEALTCREVCEKLEAIYESDRVEFKESFEKEEMLREELLRTVVGFLNTAEGHGLIVLGVRDPSKPGERVKCLDKNLFKWNKAGQIEAHIRDTILENLKTISRAITPPHLGVRVFDCRSDCGLGRDGWLILVYVEKTSDAVYYSYINNIPDPFEASKKTVEREEFHGLFIESVVASHLILSQQLFAHVPHVNYDKVLMYGVRDQGASRSRLHPLRQQG